MVNSFNSKRQFVVVLGLVSLLALAAILLTDGLSKSSLANETAYNAETLIKYKTPYIGNASKVGNIIDNLQHADYRKEIFLETKTKPYGVEVKYDFSNSGLDLQQIKSGFHNNAVIMFTLIENVDIITFNIVGFGEETYQFTRQEIQEAYENKLSIYSKDVNTFEDFLKNNIIFKVFVHPGVYTPAMSSTPGIRISAEYLGSEGKIRYSAEHGLLTRWDIISGKVSEGEATIELEKNTPVYWAPGRINEQGSKSIDYVVNVTPLDDNGEVIDERQVIINYDGRFYTVKPSENIIIGTKNY